MCFLLFSSSGEVFVLSHSFSLSLLWPTGYTDKQAVKAKRDLSSDNNWTKVMRPKLRGVNGTPLQYFAWKIPWMEEPGRLQSMGVAKSRTQLSDFTFTFHFSALEKEMATHSSVLAWRIPGMGEPGGLPSMGSHRVGHDWSDLAAAAWL